MSEAKKRCQLDGCNRAASACCFCCNRNVCTRHFIEHIDAIKAQIDPLANEINTMVEIIQDLTIEQITEISFAELQQWRSDMHKLIDEIFLTKTKETEELIEKNKEKFDEHKKQQSATVMKIQDDVRQLVEDGDATFEQIQLLKNQLASVETNLVSFGKDFLSVSGRVFAEGLVTVSSNLNKPLVIQNKVINQPPQNLQTDPVNAPFYSTRTASTTVQAKSVAQKVKYTHVGPNIAAPKQQSTGFAFGVCSGSQNNSTTQPLAAPFGMGFSSPATTSIFGTPTPVSSSGSNNNASPFRGAFVSSQHKNKGQK